MYERFTDRARKVMQLANQEAQRFNHEYIGTEHILLGLVAEGGGVGANVLKNLDVNLQTIRNEVEKIVQSGPEYETLGKLPLTPRAKKVIEFAIEEAKNINHNYVGTEHLLLGLLREQEGVGAQVLMNLGLRLEDVREEVLNLLGHGPEPDTTAPTVQIPREGASRTTETPARSQPAARATGGTSERFTDRARKVMRLANQEAQRFNHEYIGTEHVLLGLIKEGTGVTARVFRSVAIDLRKVRLEVEKIVQAGPDMVTMGTLPQTPRAKKVIEYAIAEADDLVHNDIDAEHLLLGFLRQPDGSGMQALQNLAVKPALLRQEVLKLLMPDEEARAAPAVPTGMTPPRDRTSSPAGRVESPRPAVPDNPYARFTDRARKVMQLANQEAQRFNQAHVGTEHVLLGLVKEGSGVAANVLKNLDVELRKIRLEAEKVAQPGPGLETLGPPSLLPGARRVVDHALAEARDLNHSYAGTEHILLALLREPEEVAAQILVNLGLKLEDVREEVLNLLGPPATPARPRGIVTQLSPDLRQRASARVTGVLQLAEQETLRRNADALSTRDLIVGLLEDGAGTGVALLSALAVDLAWLRSQLSADDAPAVTPSTGRPTLTFQLSQVLRHAREEADSFEQSYVGTEHLVLGLLRELQGVGKVLRQAGATLDAAHQQIRLLLGTPPDLAAIDAEIETLDKKKEAAVAEQDYVEGAHQRNEADKLRKKRAALLRAWSDRCREIDERGEIGRAAAARPPTAAAPVQRVGLRQQLDTLPFSHVVAPAFAAARAADWLRGAAAAGRALPLALAHDVGLLLSRPAAELRLARPEHLPYDLDTSPYLRFLQRVAARPLVRELPLWRPPLGDAAVSVVLARLVGGLTLPDAYRVPRGPAGVLFLRALASEVGHRTSPASRPDWNAVLPPAVLARIESNLHALDRDEIRFLAQYGPAASGAPDPRELVDLLALTDLPENTRLALSQTLRLLPHVGARGTGGVQTYPEGGFEGLARKGSLDSLLPTELAYDDRMFLHRVVNREALYYGRERPRDRLRELAWIVAEVGAGLGGDGSVLARALLLALGQTMSRRGYEVQYSFVGAGLGDPRPLDRSGEVGRVLYHREAGRTDEEAVLHGVLRQLRQWSDSGRRCHVLWVLNEHFDADGADLHEPLYRALRAEAGQQAWFVRVRGSAASRHRSSPAAAVHFPGWQVVETASLWRSAAERLDARGAR